MMHNIIIESEEQQYFFKQITARVLVAFHTKDHNYRSKYDTRFQLLPMYDL